MPITEAANKARIKKMKEKKQQKLAKKERMKGNKFASNNYVKSKKKKIYHDPYNIKSDVTHNNFNSLYNNSYNIIDNNILIRNEIARFFCIYDINNLSSHCII